MDGLSLLIMVLQEKSEKDIINFFKYKAGYYIYYILLYCITVVVDLVIRTSERPLSKSTKIIKFLYLLLCGSLFSFNHKMKLIRFKSITSKNASRFLMYNNQNSYCIYCMKQNIHLFFYE